MISDAELRANAALLPASDNGWRWGTVSSQRFARCHLHLRIWLWCLLGHPDLTHDLTVPRDGGARTLARQRELKAAGVTRLTTGSRHVVTPDRPLALAVDIVPIVGRRPKWDRGVMERIAPVGKHVATELGIELAWGGDWEWFDGAHWELSRDVYP